MTLANLEKHHARLKWLASGEFTERDFDFTIKANNNPNGKKGEGGWTTQGDFLNNVGSKRKELIMSKAKKALDIFELKYPNFKEVKKTVEPKVIKGKEKKNAK